MKKSILVALLALSPVFAFAGDGPSNSSSAMPVSYKTIVLQAPSSIRYENIETSFDGSITINNPKIYAEGDWRAFYGGSATYICKMFKRTYVTSTGDAMNSSSTGVAVIGNDGKLRDVVSGTESTLDSVTCR